MGTGEYGNAIISQYPIQSYKTIQLTSGAEQRVMGHAVIKIGDKAVNFLNTHLEQSDPTRATQINEIAQYGQELDSFILTGDFNTSAANLTPIGATILRNSGIDKILLKNYSGSDPVVVNNSYSDHKMVYADVSLTPVVTGARIATFNTHILQDVKGNAATMANFIQSHNLEIVGLQEVDNNTGRNGCTINQAKALAEELGWYWGYSKAISLGSGEYGHAIISKYPIQSYKTVQLGSASEEQRVFGHAVIQAGDHTINFLNTHLSWQNMQMPQIAEIADYVKNMNSYIITGDFNTLYGNLTSIAGTKVNNGTDVFITNEDGAIDNIIVKGYTVGKGTMVETEYSDHNMLYADITF
ncbi:MAG: endonuclease/exonuclease/phosphatase family protein [Clostridia bacterium]|nr:endonuclease/exonuclease/phosphatase family protein [Clostridia bacterium]